MSGLFHLFPIQMISGNFLCGFRGKLAKVCSKKAYLQYPDHKVYNKLMVQDSFLDLGPNGIFVPNKTWTQLCPREKSPLADGCIFWCV